MEIISERHITKQRKQFLQANDKLYEGVELPTKKTLDLPLNTEIIRQAHGWRVKKMSLRMNIELQLYLQAIIFCSSAAGFIERYMEGAIFRFHKSKIDDPIMAATNLFREIINIHPFEDGNGSGNLSLDFGSCFDTNEMLPIFSHFKPFHRGGRRHYIRAVKMFDRKPSMLYTMIVKSLVHCWDNFEKNARMLGYFDVDA